MSPPSPVTWPEFIQGLLQQPASGQGAARPEEARQAGAGFPPTLPGVALQQEAGPLEFPGHPTVTPGQVPAAATGDPQAHPSRTPGHSLSGKGCMFLFNQFIIILVSSRAIL